MLLKNNDTQTTQQIIPLMTIVLSQNYFTFRNKIYQPEKGVSMGTPISSTIAEIFLQCFEDMHIKQLFDAKNIVFYTCHVDDIVIIYKHQKSTPWPYQYTHKPDTYTYIKLSPTYENNGCICFLDLFIIQKPSSLETDILRKPTTTVTTINFFPNHPIEHKIANFRYHITRIHSLPFYQRRNKKNGH